MRLLEGFDQISYVTNDMTRALEIMEQEYAVGPFRTFPAKFQARVGDLTGPMELIVSVAEINGLKVEVIEPVVELGDIYSRYLAPEREAGLAFHHTGVRIGGDDDTLWNERYAALEKAGKVYYTGDSGPNVKFVYVDERARLGHFVEHSWVRPGTF